MLKIADFLISDKCKKLARICAPASQILHALPLAHIPRSLFLVPRPSSLVSARSERCSYERRSLKLCRLFHEKKNDLSVIKIRSVFTFSQKN